MGGVGGGVVYVHGLRARGGGVGRGGGSSRASSVAVYLLWAPLVPLESICGGDSFQTCSSSRCGGILVAVFFSFHFFSFFMLVFSSPSYDCLKWADGWVDVYELCPWPLSCYQLG